MADEEPRDILMTRRGMLASSGLLIAVTIAGEQVLVPPRVAAREGAVPAVLSAIDAQVLAHFGEALVPGAKAAGVVPFVDSQLARAPNESLLIARYFGVQPPYADFYRSGLESLDNFATEQTGKRFAELPLESARGLTQTLISGAPQPWAGPPAALFALCCRSDAVDVVFGTPEGFAALGILYMEHILPPRSW